MLGSSLVRTTTTTTLLRSSSSSLFPGGRPSDLLFSRASFPSRQRVGLARRVVRSPVASVVLTERCVRTEAEEKPVWFKVRAAVTVRRRKQEDLKERIASQLDAFLDKMGKNVVMELLSTEMNPSRPILPCPLLLTETGKPKTSNRAAITGWFEKKNTKAERVVYTAEFAVDSSFGEPGAITVLNRHQSEFFLESIVVEGFACGPVHFTCNSWVQPTSVHPNKRVFFGNKTPAGLRELRQQELKELRGGGNGERKPTDRIYDYDTYNDLGNPDKGIEFARPTLGGEKMPFPRRLRTGRAPTTTGKRQKHFHLAALSDQGPSDTILYSHAESRVEDPLPVYVPRDERFEEGKQEMLEAGARKAVLHNLVPLLVASLSPESHDFKAFHELDNLFKEGLRLKRSLQDQLFHKLPFVTKIEESSEGLLRYDTPDIITTTHVIYNKLFILDFHDVYLPFLDRINAQDGRKAYGTRTIFFLTELGTLKPIAIELSLPPVRPGDARTKRVLTPPTDATGNWLWQLAKAHVCSNDAGVHQLVNHWLRTHASVEPFILAAHRQLSAMHPIFKLLKPHMRYTLEVNALARQILINGGGVIESGFTPGPVCMEISAAAYRDHWRFDQEALPADLIRRQVSCRMAVEDKTQPHGLRLVIEDYPYATDGLLLWSAIQSWVETYVAAYYSDAEAVQSDSELQSWYSEAVNVGHADKRHAAWWPRLSSPAELSSVLTTLIWLSSAQHAALNFGQYPLGGYIPNRPPLMRRL
ncbi:hypothetical protein BHE74_00041725, partial [Ensete ventricosum]